MNKKILTIAIIIIIVLVFAVGYFTNKEEETIYPIENEITDNKDEIAGDENEIKEPEDEITEDKETIDSFVQCLADAGMIIYGSETCPACAALVDSFGGYDKIKPIYVECYEEWERCSREMKTNYVPEIQIKGEVYTGPNNLDSLANAVGCEI